MGIHRLNHAVLYIGDLTRSVAFYSDVLGFRVVNMTPDGFRGAAFLQAPGSTNDHDLGLFEIGAAAGPSEAGPSEAGPSEAGPSEAGPSEAGPSEAGPSEAGPSEAGPSEAGRRTVGLYHLAWEVDTLDELERTMVALAKAGALVGSSDHGTTKSLYGKDPDGLEFEVVWLIPAELLDEAALAARKRIGPLELAKEKARFGAQTRGGVGISIPA